MKLIEPRNLKGFRDYLPAEQVSRERIAATIKRVFERFGFEPIDTPALEYEDILAGKYGDEGEKLMYRFKDHGGRNVAMRYDLTVPLARLVAQYGNVLPHPFKRYQIAAVWRAENTQKGRYREFVQCDADIIGAPIGIADAECIAMVETVLQELGIEKYVVKINNRKLLNAIMLTAGIPKDKVLDGIRAIDKIEKVGAKAVAEELERDLAMKPNEAEGLIRLASTKVPDIGALKTFMNKHILRQQQGQQGFEELNNVFIALREFGIKNVEIDLALARGLDYYTSTIIEASLNAGPAVRSIGSVAGGGRYDKLLNMFTGSDMPGVGVAFGLDRLFLGMQELGLAGSNNIVDVLVLNMDGKYQKKYLEIVAALRGAGINSEIYYEPLPLKKQFNFAQAKHIPFAVLYGSDEEKNSRITVRDLNTRKQTDFAEKVFLKNIKQLIDARKN